FFFSSRGRHTRFSRDWSSDVCSSDLGLLDIYVSTVDGVAGLRSRNELFINNGDGTFTEGAEEFGLAFRGYGTQAAFVDYDLDGRSEERRVGKECGNRVEQ